MKKKTLYEFLDVEPDASPEEIKVAALYLAKKYHPVQYPGNPRVAARFKKIKLVYNVLANPQKRAAYDAALAKNRGETLPLEQPATPPKETQKKESTELRSGETIVYCANIHWFGYLKALLLMLIPAYFLFVDPALLNISVEKIEFLQDKLLYVKLGLRGLLLLGLLILLHTLLRQFTTTLIITSRRTIAKFGFIPRKQIEMTHAQFEDIKIKQSILGKRLNFGKIKIRGTRGKDAGVIKINVSNVASPKQFEKRLMRIIKHSAYHRI